MVNTSIELFTVITGGVSAIAVGTVSYVIKRSITTNATKENVLNQARLLQKDIEHNDKEIQSCKVNQSLIESRFIELKDSFKDKYVTKQELKDQMKLIDGKLEVILKFVRHEHN